MHERNYGSGIDMEDTHEKFSLVLGRLKDFGLGNLDGIPSIYANSTAEELNEIARQDADDLVDVTNTRLFACIDGRKTLKYADGSPSELRLRRVGGSASNLGVALNSGASIIDTLDIENMSIGDLVEAVDEIVGERSSHLGGCGGANGEIDDSILISSDPSAMGAVEAFMSIPEVSTYLEVGFDEYIAKQITINAEHTARLLKVKGWDGQKYVSGVTSQNPYGVEELAVDESDHRFHGHKEGKVVIVLGDKTSAKDDEFVWNLKASKLAAAKLAGQSGGIGYQRAIIADIAKHFAVCKRLPSVDTPVLLLGS